jgi:hypothetical protein
MKPDAVGKKPFSPPQLTVYGDIKSITLALSPTGMGDGGLAGLTTT